MIARTGRFFFVKRIYVCTHRENKNLYWVLHVYYNKVELVFNFLSNNYKKRLYLKTSLWICCCLFKNMIQGTTLLPRLT